jgi:hypothetical protein
MHQRSGVPHFKLRLTLLPWQSYICPGLLDVLHHKDHEGHEDWLSPSIHKFGNEFIPSGLSAEGALFVAPAGKVTWP